MSESLRSNHSTGAKSKEQLRQEDRERQKRALQAAFDAYHGIKTDRPWEEANILTSSTPFQTKATSSSDPQLRNREPTVIDFKRERRKREMRRVKEILLTPGLFVLLKQKFPKR